jgi:ribosome-binding ATPase YchF (GTP1/OBG family)
VNDSPLTSAGGNTPIPDPTTLTREAVDRAVAQWQRDLAAVREIIEARLDAADTATTLRLTVTEQNSDSLREVLLSRILNVEAVSNERFAAIATQFAERDTRTVLAADESRVSLKAALDAAKEAVSEQNKANSLAIGKSEDATKERLDALALLMTASSKSLEDKIGEAVRRLDRGEGRAVGLTDGAKILIAAVGLIATAATLIGAVIALKPG